MTCKNPKRSGCQTNLTAHLTTLKRAPFRPSETIHTTKRHRKNEGRPSSQEAHNNVQTVTKFDRTRQANSTQKSSSLTFLLPLFSLTTTPLCVHSSSTVRERLFCTVQSMVFHVAILATFFPVAQTRLGSSWVVTTFQMCSPRIMMMRLLVATGPSHAKKEASRCSQFTVNEKVSSRQQISCQSHPCHPIFTVFGDEGVVASRLSSSCNQKTHRQCWSV